MIVKNNGIQDRDNTQTDRERKWEELEREREVNTDRTFGAPLITVVAPPLRWVVTSILFFHFPSTWSSYSTLSMFQTSILFYSTLLSNFCFFFLLINFSIFDFFVGFFLISTVNLEALEFFWGDWFKKICFFLMFRCVFLCIEFLSWLIWWVW